MDRYQYMGIAINYFTEEMRNNSDITSIEEHGYVHVEIRKGIYGLKNAVIIVFKQLVKILPP